MAYAVQPVAILPFSLSSLWYEPRFHFLCLSFGVEEKKKVTILRKNNYFFTSSNEGRERASEKKRYISRHEICSINYNEAMKKYAFENYELFLFRKCNFAH
jgi:hypothetical protein